jgi:hypothetical protein
MCLDNILIRNVLKLTRRIYEFLLDFVHKLNYCNEIANTKTKAHPEVKHSSVFSTREGRLGDRRTRESRE